MLERYSITICLIVLSAKLLHCIKKLSAQLSITSAYTAYLDIYYYIQLIWNFTVRFSKYFAKKALNAIPDYSAADFLALPSHYESFGLVVLEALACGTPVVATPVGGVDTILIEGVNGVVADHSDENAIARAITRLLDAPPSTQETIRATVSAFDWKAVAASMATTYGELLDNDTPIECAHRPLPGAPAPT